MRLGRGRGHTANFAPPLHSKKAARQEPRRSLPNAFFDGLSGKSQGRGSSPSAGGHKGRPYRRAPRAARAAIRRALSLQGQIPLLDPPDAPEEEAE